MPRWRWILMQMTRRLWVRASLIGLLGVLAAILAAFVDHYIPWRLPGSIGVDAIEGILNIIASSMLAVTTFSLSVMTSAYGSATSNVTPRATKLLMQDRVTQNVLSTFIGSFLFGIVGIVVLKTGVYGDRGRVILFFVTIGVIVLIVVSLLRWIDHLTRLGQVGETTKRVEQATRSAMEARMDAPCLGGKPLADIPSSAVPVTAKAIGYLEHVDMEALSRCGEALEGDVFVAATPGAFIYPDTPLAWIEANRSHEEPDRLRDDIRGAFSIGEDRSFDQDPRFGLVVMSEIALRALSPAMNDPGTAIDVIGRMTRLLSLWAQAEEERPDREVQYPRVHVPPLRIEDLFEDAFMPMARDGAGMIEVQVRIQKALQALARTGSATFRAAASHQAQMAVERAEAALTLEADRLRLRAVVQGEESMLPALRRMR